MTTHTASTTETTIAISADKGIPKANLDQLSKQTNLPLLTPKLKADYLLHLTTDYLELRKLTQTGKKTKVEAIHIDFVQGKNNHRRLHGGGKGQDIAKAIGLHKITNPTVLDLTAGMGGDAFVLASLGAQVTLVERNPFVHALLDDAFGRAALSADPELQTSLKIHETSTVATTSSMMASRWLISGFSWSCDSVANNSTWVLNWKNRNSPYIISRTTAAM